jgi:hypothetical protein
MNATIAIESLGNTLGNKRAFAITAQNSEIVKGGGVNYSLTPTKNRYPHNAACATSLVAAPFGFLWLYHRNAETEETLP